MVTEIQIKNKEGKVVINRIPSGTSEDQNGKSYHNQNKLRSSFFEEYFLSSVRFGKKYEEKKCDCSHK